MPVAIARAAPYIGPMKVAHALSRKAIRTRYKLAKVCGVTPQAVYQWREHIPDEHTDKVRQFLTQQKG